MAEKVLVEIEVDESGAVKNVDKLGGSLESAKKQADQLSGGLISGFQNAVKGVRTAVKSFGALKTAIAATGIGILVIAAAALVELFTNFEKPLKIVDSVMNAIGGAVNALVESFDKLLSGDISGFFSDVVDGASNAIDATNDLYDANERLFELQRATIVQNAKLKASVEENLKIAADTTLSLDQRLEAQEKVNGSTEKLIDNERQLAAVELERLEAELAIENNYKTRRELEIQIEQTTANLIGIEAALNRQRLDAAKSEREIIAQDNALKEAAAKEELNLIIEVAKAREESVKEREDSLKKITEALQSENRKEVVAVQDKYAELIRLAEKYGQDTLELERKRQEELRALGDKEIAIRTGIENVKADIPLKLAPRKIGALQGLADDEVAIEKVTAQAKLNIASTLLGSVASIAEEGTALSKGLATVAVLTDAAAAAVGIFKGWAGLGPFGIAGQIAQGAALAATVVSSLRQINSASPSSSGGGGGGSSRGGASSGPSAPSVSQSIGIVAPNQGQQGIGQQIQDGLGGATIRAYAVGQDISNQQQLDRQIASNGSFG
jgi:hypothetical protein